MEYPIERGTTSRSVFPGIPYYVGRDFQHSYGYSWRELQRVERNVERLYSNKINISCDRERKRQRRLVQEAHRLFSKKEKVKAVEQARSMSMPNCDRLEEMQRR